MNLQAVRTPFEMDAGRHASMVWIGGGTFRMGSDNHCPEEAPARRVRVDGFRMDNHAVTNKALARFVADTHYVTSAERPANPEDYPGADPSTSTCHLGFRCIVRELRLAP